MSVDMYFRSINPKIYEKAAAEPKKAFDFVFNEKFLQPFGKYDGFANLGTDWHALHFVLSGNPFKATETLVSQAVMGGEKIGSNAFGYDPLRFYKPQLVKEISEALDALDYDSLASKYSYDDFTSAMIYEYSGSREVKKTFGYLKDFYRQATGKGNALVGYCQ